MKKEINKKGFTLIELLAVILILGIIALIAIPTVNKIIEESKRGSFKTTVENLLRAAEQDCQLAQLKGQAIIDNYTFENGMVKTFKDEKLENVTLNVKGDLPKSGKIIVGDSCEVSAQEISDGTFVANTKNGNISVTKADETSVAYVCRRATTLHEKNGKTYGNLGIKGTLTSGDAFDCDVNGDGNYDHETERFYYVSDYYDTNSNQVDQNNAVLIYYNNIANSTYNYLDVSSGPADLVSILPTKNDWKNVSLINSERKILNKDDSGSYKFNYGDSVARLLTYQEIEDVCDLTIEEFTIGLSNCDYLMESNDEYWFETIEQWSVFVMNVSAEEIAYFGGDSSFGVRPVIEVPKSQIDK